MNTTTETKSKKETAPGTERLSVLQFIKAYHKGPKWGISQMNRLGCAVRAMSDCLGYPSSQGWDPGIGRCLQYPRALLEMAYAEVSRK